MIRQSLRLVSVLGVLVVAAGQISTETSVDGLRAADARRMKVFSAKDLPESAAYSCAASVN
jgi:hypothetical protein